MLAAAAQYDDFTARLLDVLRATRPERAAQAGREVVFGVHRSDYMLDAPSGRFLQVGRAAGACGARGWGLWGQLGLEWPRVLRVPPAAAPLPDGGPSRVWLCARSGAPAAAAHALAPPPTPTHHTPPAQVELNTIASSFGCLSTLMTRLHRHVLARAGGAGLDASRLPDNAAMANIAQVIAGAPPACLQRGAAQQLA